MFMVVAWLLEPIELGFKKWICLVFAFHCNEAEYI